MTEVKKRNIMERQIYAHYDETGVIVYQAFKPSTVKAALEKGTFGKGFSMERMTWIKPSFAWMLYRSGYASKTRQEAILKIKLTHDGFREILSHSVATHYNSHVYKNEDDWRITLKKSPVRHQWDPERNLKLGKLDRRAIQIGIRGWVVEKYVNEWIIGLEEVTKLAHDIHYAIKNNRPDLPSVPDERVYPIDETLKNRLGSNAK